jgi:hypothetical protein
MLSMLAESAQEGGSEEEEEGEEGEEEEEHEGEETEGDNEGEEEGKEESEEEQDLPSVVMSEEPVRGLASPKRGRHGKKKKHHKGDKAKGHKKHGKATKQHGGVSPAHAGVQGKTGHIAMRQQQQQVHGPVPPLRRGSHPDPWTPTAGGVMGMEATSPPRSAGAGSLVTSLAGNAAGARYSGLSILTASQVRVRTDHVRRAERCRLCTSCGTW